MHSLNSFSASERSTTTGRQSHKPFLSLTSTVASILSLSSICRPAAAASVRFENCLPESRLQSEPKLLQWVPHFFDASFNTSDPKYTLQVKMWGNVTGSATGSPLPPPDNPDWLDPNKTDGKIANVPDRDPNDPWYTALRSKVEVLSYETWKHTIEFCNTSLAENFTCPLGPVFEPEDSNLIPWILPFVSMSHDFYSSYAFTSFTATFVIADGDRKGTFIGCASAVVTPDLGDLAWMLKFLPLVVLVFVGAATVFAAIFSPWGTSDIFHWSSNYGRDPDLLRLVTPGFGDCLHYIQFVVLTGALTLNYPGFYQPMVSQASWSALMFNQSFVSNSTGWQAVQDGIYVTSHNYGLGRLAQLSGMAEVSDVWPGMMAWLLVIIAGVFILVQAGFLFQWLHRAIRRIPEEDLRAKNIPFTIGNVVRIVLNYFLFPLVALSTFQLVVAPDSPIYTIVLGGVTVLLIIGLGSWMLHLIATTKPRAFLFDDLATLLLYGPLYNTYSDEAVAFTLVPVILTFIRGIAVGAVQPAGVAQVVLLAVCEVIQILTIHAFRPFHSPTSMNAYHTLFATVRLVTVLLMVAFVPSLGVSEGAKGWIGYAILVTHASVLVLGFLLNAIQTIVEVAARMLGAGGDDIRGQSRGGLSKIFGMRQLSRRASRRENGPSRQSQLSSSAMLDLDDASKTGYIMPNGRLRSESAGSMGAMIHHRQTSLSGMDTPSLDGPARRHDSVSGSFTPTTPGEASTFSFLPSPGHPVRPPGALSVQASDPYYRPPRQRRPTIELSPSPAPKMGGTWMGADLAQQKRLSQAMGTVVDPAEIGPQISRDVTPAPYAIPFTPRTDYSMREADFYYGVRGERLNSYAPSRKLGTGPADPTGPMASAAGWLRNMFKPKGKDKGKGFEVVRSARMPPAMRATGGDFQDDSAPEGIPVAMGVLRNGPIESDDDDSGKRATTQTQKQESSTNGLGITKTGGAGAAGKTGDSAGSSEYDEDAPPDVPRKSSKRDSNSHAKAISLLQPPEPVGAASLTPSNTASSRLPFERTPSQKRLSGSSAGLTEEFSQADLQDPSGSSGEVTATGYGFVNQGNVHRVDRDVDLLGLGTSAEVVNERR
ncbi:putative flavin carrier protein 3 [Podospora fimiseda]|uniref:Flavin carrier protein 3 n=1 Tax=Podospora fimiseda TaxID=252190 RepID=A0AAN7BJU0_9PEZI|nr:putative flavin carrier protein 3 [Podospora fimiseda]